MNEQSSSTTTVVIVNYRSEEHVRRCVNSLKGMPVKQITIVDNNSGPKHVEKLHLYMEEHTGWVQIVENPQNSGFGAGINVGVNASELSETDFIWILNPDTLVRSGCLEGLHSAVSAGLDIASPVVVTGPQDKEIVWFAGGSLNRRKMTTSHHSFGKKLEVLALDSPLEPCTFLTGAAMFMRVDTWHRLGGFREDLFMYWEDADLCARAQALGLKLGTSTHSFIWHAVGATSGTSGLSPLYYYHMQRNRTRLAREWGRTKTILAGPGVRQTLKLLIDPYLESHGRLAGGRSSIMGLVDGFKRR